MGWFAKESKAFGREFTRQGSILLFGKAPKKKVHHTSSHKKKTGAQIQYEKAQQWAKDNGFK